MDLTGKGILIWLVVACLFLRQPGPDHVANLKELGANDSTLVNVGVIISDDGLIEYSEPTVSDSL